MAAEATCIGCGETKPAAEFYAKPAKRNGLTSRCRACHREQIRVWKAAHPEQRREQLRRWRVANPEAGMEAYWRRMERDPERLRETSRRRYAANPEHYRQKAQRWREANPEAAAAAVRRIGHLRRMVKQAPASDLTAAEEVRLWEEAKVCPLCGCTLLHDEGTHHPQKPNLDHEIPLNVGGCHTASNVRIICRTCNLRRPKDGTDLVLMRLDLMEVA